MLDRKRAVVTTLLLALTVGVACEPRADGGAAAEDRGPEVVVSMPRLPRWAAANANVRAGSGTSFPVVASLERGERVEIGALENGWYEVFREGEQLGYVAQSVLVGTPLPESAFELREVTFDVIERGQTAWRYAWTLDLENTGREPLSDLTAEVKFVDANRYLVGADTARGLSLAPGQRRAFRGEVSLDLPQGAAVRAIGAEITRPEQPQD